MTAASMEKIAGRLDEVEGTLDDIQAMKTSFEDNVGKIVAMHVMGAMKQYKDELDMIRAEVPDARLEKVIEKTANLGQKVDEINHNMGDAVKNLQDKMKEINELVKRVEGERSKEVKEIRDLYDAIKKEETNKRTQQNIVDRKGFEGLSKWCGGEGPMSFDVWRFEVNNFLIGSDGKFKDLLKWLESQREDVQDDEVEQFARENSMKVDKDGKGQGTIANMAEQLNALLARKTGDTPLSLVRVQEETPEGVEVYLRGLRSLQAVYKDAIGVEYGEEEGAQRTRHQSC